MNLLDQVLALQGGMKKCQEGAVKPPKQSRIFQKDQILDLLKGHGDEDPPLDTEQIAIKLGIEVNVASQSLRDMCTRKDKPVIRVGTRLVGKAGRGYTMWRAK